ncbi:MAG: hypothetical protein FD129_689 [bacterium]|nr:MAG: hypothetical protein FD129_689 [bacterium]
MDLPRRLFNAPWPARLIPGILLAVTLAVSACSDDDGDDPSANACNTENLPLTDDADGPVLTEVTLECQGANINVLATITDPQGDDDLLQVIQRIIVHGRSDCEGDLAYEVVDDVAGSGLEESFGIALDRATNAALFDQICSVTEWPVQVQLYDASGNVTTGRVMARVTD